MPVCSADSTAFRSAATLIREMERPWAGRLVPSAVAGEMRPFFDYVERCVPPDQRLLVAAWLPEGVLAQRPFAGGQLWFMPARSRRRPITNSSCGGSIASVCRSCSAARRPTSSRSSSPSSTPTSVVLTRRRAGHGDGTRSTAHGHDAVDKHRCEDGVAVL